jgi:putative heme-binding domain-containing protein
MQTAKGEDFEPWQFKAADDLLAKLTGLPVAKRVTKELTPMFSRASVIAAKENADVAHRVAALRLLRWSPVDERLNAETLVALLNPSQASEVQFAALQLMTAPANSNSEGLERVLKKWRQYTPALRNELLDRLLVRPDDTRLILDAIENETLHSHHFNAQRRRQLLEHPDAEIRKRAANVFSAVTDVSKEQLIQQYADRLERTGDTDRGRHLFAKHCTACHRLEGIGHEVGPDLAALTNRSPITLLTAILDPNRAVEDKFLSYTAVTDEGRIHNGMLVAEAGQSITLRTAEGKSVVLLRNRLEEIRSSEKSFMPEGFERDLNAAQLADLVGYLASIGPRPKSFAGNTPAVVRPDDDGVIHLQASNARIYGSRIVFESKYKNLGWWQQEDDRAAWTIEDVSAGDYQVAIEYACQNGVAGNAFELQLSTNRVSGKVVGTGSWDDYQWRNVGRVSLAAGRHEVVLRSLGPIHGALLDLREIRLTPARN